MKSDCRCPPSPAKLLPLLPLSQGAARKGSLVRGIRSAARAWCAKDALVRGCEIESL